jgi:hypothetical protein
MRLAFQELYQQDSPKQAAQYLKRWYFWATHSRLSPMIDAAHTVKRHWNGILRWFDSKIANGLIEGINSLVQARKGQGAGLPVGAQPQGHGLSVGGQTRPPTTGVRMFLPTVNSEEPVFLHRRGIIVSPNGADFDAGQSPFARSCADGRDAPRSRARSPGHDGES